MNRPHKLLVFLCALVGLLVATPVLTTLWQAATSNPTDAWSALTNTNVPRLLFNALLVAIIVTPICGVLGVATAWLVERTDLPGRKIWPLILIMPITIPLFVTSFAWSELGDAFRGLLGAVLIVSFSYYPIVYLLCAVALRGMDSALEESARALGANGRQLFFRVVLPQLRPALLGGLLVIVLDALVEFDAFVGIHYSVFAGSIYDQYRVSFSTSGAAVLACLSTLMCVAILSIEARLRGNRNYVSVRQGAQRQAIRYALGRSRWPAVAALLLLGLAAVGIPFALTVKWFGQTGLSTASTSVAGALIPAAVSSVVLGVVSALGSVLLALPVAVLATGYSTRAATLLERATYLSFALPDLVAAIALSFLASQFLAWLYGSVAVLVFAYAILFCPIALLALRVSFGQIENSYDHAARSLGAGPLSSLVRVGLPIARPGIAGAIVLVFAFVLSDLSTTQVLAPAGISTLGTQFWSYANTVALGAAAPYAAALMALAALAAFVLMSRFGKTRLSA